MEILDIDLSRQEGVYLFALYLVPQKFEVTYDKYTCNTIEKILFSYMSLEEGKVFGKFFGKPLGNVVETSGPE